MKRVHPRVLLVGPKSPPYAGIEACTESLITGLQSTQLEWRYFNSGKPVPNAERGHLSVVNLWWTLRRVIGLAAACIGFRPDIVHLPLAHNRMGFLRDACFILVSRLANARVLLHCHNDSYDRFVLSQPALLQAFVRRVYGWSAGIVVQGTSLRGQFERLGLGDRLLLLTNHLDVASFAPARSHGSPGGPYTVLLLGRVSVNKGAWDLAQAGLLVARRLARPVRVVFTGETVPADKSVAHLASQSGDVRGWIKTLLRDEPGALLTVSYLGTLDFPEKLRALREADVLALPSRSEALPYAILEGAAAGLPIVATSVGMIPELVARGLRADLIAPTDITGLADALVRLADPTLRRQEGFANVEFATREFDVTLLTSRLESLYQAVMGVENTPATQPA